MTMTQNEAILEVLNRISNQYTPQQTPLLAIEGTAMIEDGLKGKLPKLTKEDPGHHQFGGQIVEVIKIVAIVLGTIKTIKDLLGAKRSKTLELTEANKRDLMLKWKERLVSEGVEEGTAKRITDEFTQSLLDAISTPAA